MKRFLFLMIIAFFFRAIDSSAQVSIDVVQAPNGPLLLYSPGLVVFAIVNNDSQPVLVPLNWTQNLDVRVRKMGKAEFPPQSSFLDGAQQVVWLHKKDKHYFYISVQHLLESSGDYELEAILHNQNSCGLSTTDTRKYYYAQSALSMGDTFPKQCWKGSIRSPIVPISVREPVTSLDLEAFAEIEKAFPAPFYDRLKMNYEHLKRSYPLSSYTKIAAIYAEDYSTLTVNDVDLLPYAQFKKAEKNALKGLSENDEVTPILKPTIDQLKRQHQELKAQQKEPIRSEKL